VTRICHARIWHTAAMTKFQDATNCLIQMKYRREIHFGTRLSRFNTKKPARSSHYA